MKYLLDTCVLSECARRNPDARLVAWLETTAEGDDFHVSAITIGEIAEGIESLPDGDPRKLRLDAWFRTEILGTYGDRIVDFDREVNDRTFGRSGVTKLSTDKSRVLIYMIPTNEELMIAQDAERIAQSVRK